MTALITASANFMNLVSTSSFLAMHVLLRRFNYFALEDTYTNYSLFLL